MRSSDFSLKVSIDEKKWHSKAQRVKGSSQAALDANRDLIKGELESLYLSARSRGLNLSAQEMKDLFLGNKELGVTYSKMRDEYIKELEARGRKPATLGRLRRSFLYLGEFLKKEMDAESIEKRHVTGFFLWLADKGYDQDNCNKLIQSCRSLFKFGIEKGYVSRNPFEGITLEWRRETDTTCLTEAELETLRLREWSPKLQRVVDSFLFMCYTGLHISDYREIGSDSRYIFEGMEFMKIRRVKSNVEAVIPLADDAMRIISKYGGLDQLPKISGQRSNDYLKLIAESAGISTHLTNKIARKTFTDICLNSYHLSAEVVAAMLGHTTTKQLRHYGKIKERRILNEWKKRVDVA